VKLPEYPRVVFKKPPLALTLAQVRFMPRFAVLDPGRLAGFQEALGENFPDVKHEAQIAFNVSSQGIQSQQQGAQLLRFTTKDELTSVVLSPDALTLEIRRFSTIEKLQAAFRKPLQALLENFKPPKLTRIGLRFVNEFRHPKGDSLAGWKALIRPEIIGLVGNEVLSDWVHESLQQIVMGGEDHTTILRHGFLPGGSTVPGPEIDQESQGSFYLLDLDSFRLQESDPNVDLVLTKINEFNSELYRLFRWSMTDAMYEYCEPIDAKS